MTLSLPPSYVPLPVSVIEEAYKPDKPHRALFASFIRLLALAWQHKYESTDRILEEELYNTINKDGSTKFGYLKMSRREYFIQKREMELLGWLRSTRPATGFVQFHFSRKVALDDSAENRTDVQKTAPLIGGGESINLNLNTDSPLTPPQDSSAENCTTTTRLPGVKDILYHADKLFDGASVSSMGIEDRDPRHALAWCAYAYRERAKLTGPGGLVRKRLMNDQHPPEWALLEWQETLPSDFLEALSLIEYSCPVCGTTFGKMAELTAHEATHPRRFTCSACDQDFENEEDLDTHYDQEHMPKRIPPDESVSRPIREGSAMTAEQAWDCVLDQLQRDVPRISFDTWVRDTKAVRYDGNTLTIGVRNTYAREWLESRLASTVSRLLVGIMNDSHIAVEFVTADFRVQS